MALPPGTPPPPPPQGPPPPPPPTDAAIVVTLQGSVLTSNVITPTVRLNGYPVPARYGENVFPLASGRWRVEVETQWLRTFGQAALDVDLRPGTTAPVFYAAPLHQFTTGSIGFEKQKRKGAAAFYGVLGVLALLVVLVVLLPVLLG